MFAAAPHARGLGTRHENRTYRTIHTTHDRESKQGGRRRHREEQAELFLGDLDGAWDDSSISGSLQSRRSTLSLYPFSLRVN